MSQLQAAQARDQSLDIVSVHAAHADHVWRTLQRLGVRAPELEDVFQEVFMVVHRKLHTFDGSCLLTTWLFAICLRTASAHRRRAYHRRECPVEEVPETAEDLQPNPEELSAKAEARRGLEEILDGMDLERRAVFVMFEIEGMNCSQIAEMMGIPLGTVYSRLSTAREEFERGAKRMRARLGLGGM